MKKILIALSVLSIFGCTENKKNTETADTETEITTPVIEKAKTDVPVANESIQKKQVDGKDILLTKAQVVGSILTVEFHVSSEKYIDYTISLSEISYIDDATSKKNGLLKDDAGVYLASPLTNTKENLKLYGYKTTIIANLKFPAPSADSKTVSINIPELGSFDAVPLTR